MSDDLVIWVGDGLKPAAHATVSVFDAGFQSGDAVWEGMRVYNGAVLRLDEHLARLEESARIVRLRLPFDRAGIASAIRETLSANSFTTDTHIRLMVTRGTRRTSGMDPSTAPAVGTLVIIAERKPTLPEPASQVLQTASVRRPQPDVVAATLHHSNQLNSIMARLEVLDSPGVDAALMLDKDGYVAEADSANIFCVHGNEVTTPIPTACLRGITRRTVLDLSRAAGYETSESRVPLHDLYSADEVFITGTICELTPIVKVDGRVVGTGTPGPVWRDLLTRYRAMVDEETR